MELSIPADAGRLVGGERILGRDVLNRLEILFRGPVGESSSIHDDCYLAAPKET